MKLCEGCQRHLKSAETTCPFCGGATFGGIGHALRTRVPTRAVMLVGAAAVGAGLAINAVACTAGTTTVGKSDAGSAGDDGDDGDDTVMPLYGASPDDSGAGDDDIGDDTALPPYGIPPPPEPDAATAPPYGLPPPVDAGPDSGT